MADANDKVPDGTQGKQDAGSGKTDNQTKVWSDDEVRKIIEERDKAKEKARKYDDDKKKAEETKAIEEGRLKEVLSERERELEALRVKAKAYEEQEKAERDELLAKIKDDNDKAIASALPNIGLIRKFVEKIESQTNGPSSTKGGRVPSQDASPFKSLQGESYTEYQRRLQKLKSERAK